MLLAEWIHEKQRPIDPELLYHWLDSYTETPERTPTLTTSLSWAEGRIQHELTMFGGVTLDPKIKYVDTRNADHSKRSSTGIAAPRPGRPSCAMDAVRRTRKQAQPLGPPIRGPTPTNVPPVVRRPLRLCAPVG